MHSPQKQRLWDGMTMFVLACISLKMAIAGMPCCFPGGQSHAGCLMRTQTCEKSLQAMDNTKAMLHQAIVQHKCRTVSECSTSETVPQLLFVAVVKKTLVQADRKVADLLASGRPSVL